MNGNVYKWMDNVSFIANRIGMNPEDFLCNMRLFNSYDVGNFKLEQNDMHSCGPIACMIIWYLFCPKSAPISLPVEKFRRVVIDKLKSMFEKVTGSEKLVIRSNEQRIENDLKRKASQETQAKKMKRLYADSVSVNIGDTVKVLVPKTLKKSHHKLDPVGLVIDVMKKTKSALVLTRHGLIGKIAYNKLREFYLDPERYEVIQNNGFLSEGLIKLQKLLRSNHNLNRHEKKFKLISLGSAHALEFARKV